jgi:hypothetical protein
MSDESQIGSIGKETVLTEQRFYPGISPIN